MKKPAKIRTAANAALNQVIRHGYQAASQAQLLQDGFNKDALATLRKDAEAIIKATYEYGVYSDILEESDDK